MLGTDQFRLLWIKPEENVLNGWWQICQYLGIKDRKTMIVWIDEWALPAIKRPDGIWMSTMTAIDQWVMLAAQVTHANKSKGRGQSAQRNSSEEHQAQSRSKAEMVGRRAEITASVVRQTTLLGSVGGMAGVQPGPGGDQEVR